MTQPNTDPLTRVTPSQRRTFNDLLGIGVPRPVCPPTLVDELQNKILTGTNEALQAWTEPSLYLTKSQLETVLACEGKVIADRVAMQSTTFSGIPPLPTVVGTVAHRAIQLAHTHHGLPVATYVSEALKSCRKTDQKVQAFMTEADMGAQSDLEIQARSRVTNFLDSWPPLAEAWEPRFEEPMQASVGKLRLSIRPDLVLGRPKPQGEQSMLIADLKSGALSERHEDEAAFYALVSTLRHGVPPFRSAVYSLASGEWTDPDVTALKLHRAADRVVAGVVALCAVLQDLRTPQLTPGKLCSWCPAKAECPAFAESEAA